MSYVKEFTRFFHTRSDSNADEVRAYLSGLMQAKRGAKNLERMEEHVPDFNYLYSVIWVRSHLARVVGGWLGF